MTLNTIGRLTGAVALTVGLAGCMDVTLDVDVLNDTTGRATKTIVMGAEFYSMAKSGMVADGAESDGFCTEEGDTLTENEDGSATCVTIAEGLFADLKIGDNSDGAKIEVLSPGVVKISFATADLQSEVGGDEAQDEADKAMMAAFFEGRSITLRVRGNEIVDTNMTRADDGKSAEVVIPLLELIDGTTSLPAEVYATVKTN